jgi:hypothetical protein
MVAHKRERSHRGLTVQFILQSVFVSQPIDHAGCGVLGRGKHGQYSGPVAVTVVTPSSAKDALTVLPQYRETTNPIRSE